MIDFEAAFSALNALGQLVLLATYIEGDSVTPAAIKDNPRLGAFVDNRGGLKSMTRAGLDNMDIGPNSVDPVVRRAYLLATHPCVAVAARSNLASIAAEKELEKAILWVERWARLYPKQSRQLWAAFYKGETQVHLFREEELTPPILKAMRQFVDRGLAPTPEGVGLIDAKTDVKFSFNTLRDMKVFANICRGILKDRAPEIEVVEGIYVARVIYPNYVDDSEGCFRGFVRRWTWVQEQIEAIAEAMGGRWVS